MTNDRLELSRRKILAGLGGVGVASTGAGLGTSAYFTDTESFEGNTITAGELDVKVAWQEHYPSKQVAGAANDSVVEAYPDPDDDAKRLDFASTPGETNGDGVGYICEDGADMAADRDPTGDGLRTKNADTFADGEPQPLINLDDVKPGDEGELTLHYHLCEGPGYVYLTGLLDSAAENGVTEPEADAPGEEDGVVELLDAIQTRLWYDDGDTVPDVGGDDPGYVTPELSLRDLLVLLETGTGVQLCPGGDTGDGAPDCPDEKDYDSVHVTGDEVTVETPETSGPTAYTIANNPKCEDFGLIGGFKTDEAPEGPLSYPATKTYETAYGDITVTTALVDDEQTVTDWEIEGDDDVCVAKVIVKGGNQGANVYSYDNPDADADFTDDENSVGAMSDENTDLQTPTGQDISHVEFCLAASTGGGDGDGDCCIEPSNDYYVGLEWWVPREVGNEIQSDSVGFDLGFYTEQCRHNGGSTST